jgi:hypothetical protein
MSDDPTDETDASTRRTRTCRLTGRALGLGGLPIAAPADATGSRDLAETCRPAGIALRKKCSLSAIPNEGAFR